MGTFLKLRTKQKQKMRALKCDASKGELTLEDVDVPEVINRNDVIIKVGFAGLCGTDLHIMQGEFAVCGSSKVTLSHEFSGTVVSVGSGVTRFKPGDNVGVDPNPPCHCCRFCVRGQVHFCQFGGPRDAYGVFRDGGAAEYCRVIDQQVFLLPKSVPLDIGALCEPLSCLLHGWDRLNAVCPLQPDSKILVTGAGIIGNLWVSILHHHGARNVTVSEPAEGRRKITLGLGTGYDITDPSHLASMMKNLDAEMEGFDIVIECSGFPPALEQAFGWTRRGATVMIFGCAPPGKAVRICPEDVFRKELTIIGSLINPCTYARAVELASSLGPRYLDYEKLGVAVFDVADYEDAIQQLKKGAIAKAVFKMT